MHSQEAQESYTYVICASDPDHPGPSVEDSARKAIAITVTWQSNTLFHQHMTPSSWFYLGTPRAEPRQGRKSKRGIHHFLLPSEVLSTASVHLVAETVHGPSVLLDEVPQDAHFTCSALSGNRDTLLGVCADHGWYDHDQGGHYWPLSQGPLRLTLGLFHIDCQETLAAKAIPRSLTSDLNGDTAAYFGLSFASAAALLASAAFFAPPLGLTDDDGVDHSDLVLMQQYLSAAAEREREPEPSPDDGQSSPSGASGERAAGAEGAMGDTKSTQSNRRFAVKGPADNPDPHVARERALQDALTFGTVGLLASFTSDPNAPTSPWGRETSLGTDERSAMGGMWGDSIGDSFGAGLGLSGLGSGGGGPGRGIGLGDIGTINHGLGASGEYGFGSDHGHLKGGRPSRHFRMRAANPVVSGRLPPQVIQRIVRQNHGRFRLCYEKGLGANPSLSGRVSVRFVIGRNGAVSNVANAGSSIASSEVVNCVVRAFYGLSFPKPEGGIVTVSYPIAFSPE